MRIKDLPASDNVEDRRDEVYSDKPRRSLRDMLADSERHYIDPGIAESELARDAGIEDIMTKWPRDNQAALIKFYGDPAKGEPGRHLVKVVPPFKLYFDGRLVKSISFHRKAAAALSSALNKIWDYYGRDQAKIDALEISKYSGAYNHRLIRGSKTKWSNHAYGAAFDINAEDNGFGTGEGAIPKAVVAAFKSEGARWGGDYKGRTDPMHFEFCDGGEPRRSFEQWLTHYGVKDRAKTKTEPDELVDEFEATDFSSRDKEFSRDQITMLQQHLVDMGYFEVGEVDGIIGSRTRAAIAAFYTDRRVSHHPVVDDHLRQEIETALGDSWERPIAKERSEATPEKVGEKTVAVPAAQNAAKASGTNKVLAWILGIPGAIWAFVKGVLDNFEGALESPAIYHIKDFFYDNVVLMALGVVGIAAAIWWKSNQAEKQAIVAEVATVESYREGRLT